MRCLITLVLVASAAAVAGEHDNALLTAQEKMSATFSNAIVTDFRESPIPGLYEAYMVDKLVYFHPDQELLVFGEIWTKDGRSLTAVRRAELAADLFDEIPLDFAVVVGPEDGIPIVEFTDPDCPYCRRYNAYTQTSATELIKRLVFFDTRAHPQTAYQKAVHILCSQDPGKALLEVYAGQDPTNWTDCGEGRKRAAVHAAISKKAGVSVTPTLYLDRTPVLGFRQAVIEDFLSERSVSLAERGE